MIDPTFIERLEAMSLQLKRHAFGKYQGDQQTVYAGDGLTFKDFAPYTLGDDFRKIDWRIFARTKELFIRRYEEDRNLTIHILLDASASMGYGSHDSKFSYAAMLALGVAYLAARNNERVEVSLFDSKLKSLKSQSQHMSLYAMVEQLNKTRPSGKTDLEGVMRRYHERVRSKALVFVFSDFLYSIEPMEALLAEYARSQVFFVQALHEDEVALPFSGENKFVDPEEEKKRLKTYVSNRLRSIYKDALDEHTQSIANACKGHEARFVQVHTGIPVLEGFLRVWKLLL